MHILPDLVLYEVLGYLTTGELLNLRTLSKDMVYHVDQVLSISYTVYRASIPIPHFMAGLIRSVHIQDAEAWNYPYSTLESLNRVASLHVHDQLLEDASPIVPVLQQLLIRGTTQYHHHDMEFSCSAVHPSVLSSILQGVHLTKLRGVFLNVAYHEPPPQLHVIPGSHLTTLDLVINRWPVGLIQVMEHQFPNLNRLTIEMAIGFDKSNADYYHDMEYHTEFTSLMIPRIANLKYVNITTSLPTQLTLPSPRELPKLTHLILSFHNLSLNPTAIWTSVRYLEMTLGHLAMTNIPYHFPNLTSISFEPSPHLNCDNVAQQISYLSNLTNLHINATRLPLGSFRSLKLPSIKYLKLQTDYKNSKGLLKFCHNTLPNLATLELLVINRDDPYDTALIIDNDASPPSSMNGAEHQAAFNQTNLLPNLMRLVSNKPLPIDYYHYLLTHSKELTQIVPELDHDTKCILLLSPPSSPPSSSK